MVTGPYAAAARRLYRRFGPAL